MAGQDRDPMTPDSLEHAFGWLERSLDDMTDAARRQREAIRRQTTMVSPGVANSAASPLIATPATEITAAADAVTAYDALLASSGRAAVSGQTDVQSGQTAVPRPASPDAAQTAPGAAPAPASATATGSATPLLDSLGRDLTALAALGN